MDSVARRRLAGCVLAFVVGASGGWFASRGSMFVTPDGGQYLAAAANIADGKGVTSPIVPETTSTPIRDQLATRGRMPFTEWPPGYPVAVAAVARLGFSTVDAARIVGAASSGVIAALLLLLVHLLTASFGAGTLVVALVFFGPVVAGPTPLQSVPFLMQPLFVLSEPLFLAAVLAATLLAAASERGRAVATATVVAIASAALIRYVGVAVGTACGVAAVGVLAADGAPGRWRRAAVYAVTGPVAIVVWSVGRRLPWGAGPTKLIGWHPPSGRRFGQIFDVAAAWFGAPQSVSGVIRVVAVLVIWVGVTAVTLVPAARRTLVGDTFDAPAPRFALLVCVVWMWVYPLTVAGASVVVDANVPFDQRVLGPAAVGVWVALVALVWVGARRRVPASFHPGGPVLAGCLCVALVPLT
ncbi:MAG: hypothetical protein ACKOYM_08850, partial [Actinomycetes bacterium]